MFDKEWDDINLNLHGVRLPEFKLEKDEQERLGLSDDTSSLDTLKALCRIGYKEKILSNPEKAKRADEYIDRIKQELSVFELTKFEDYILLVYKFVAYCHKNKIPIGPGRGSVSGSLLAYLLGITEIDSLAENLYFERFLSATRAQCTEINGINYYDGASLMDVDLDLDYSLRNVGVKYLQNEYKDKTCKVLTISTLQTKILIKEVGKIVGGYSEDEMNIISDSISVAFGKVRNIDLAAEESPRFKEFVDKNPLIIEIAKKLYEGPKSKGVHASAYLISYQPLDEYIPTENDSEGETVSSFDMHDASKLAIKLDLLGLKCVTIVDKVCKMVGIKRDDILIDSYDHVYKYLQYLDAPYGLFQISGESVVKSLNKVSPSNFRELTDVISLARPGSFAFIDQYADFKHDNSLRPDTHPFFDDILKKTNYILLYQEQLLECLAKIGFSLIEANQVRKIVGKKLRKEIDEWEAKIYEVGAKNNVPKEACKFLWEVAKASADYSFNLCVFEEEGVDHKTKGRIQIKDVSIGDEILALDVKNNKEHYVKVTRVWKNTADCWRWLIDGWKPIITSSKHKFLCADRKMWTASCIWNNRDSFKVFSREVKIKGKKLPYLRLFTGREHVGIVNTIDLEVDHPDHNFYCNGIVVSNSHATAYTRLSAISVALKMAYPLEFYLASLEAHGKEDIPVIEREAERTFGIKILRPDILRSKESFSAENGNIRFGLGGIKGINDASILKIRDFINVETVNKFQVFQSANQCKIAINVLSNIIYAGALNSLGEDRLKLVLEAQIWNELTDKEKAYCLDHGSEYDYDLISLLKDYLEWVDGSGRKFKESRLNTIRRDTAQYIEKWKKASKYTKYSNYTYEKKLLGYSYSTTLRDVFIADNPRLKTIAEVKDVVDRVQVEIIAEVKDTKKGRTQKGQPYLKLFLVDETGEFDSMFIEKVEGTLLKKGEIEEGDIVYLQGSKAPDIIWINKFTRQEPIT